MSKDLKDIHFNLKSLSVTPLINKYGKKYNKHMVFAAMLIVLLTYVLVVFKISVLSKADPSPEQVSDTSTLIPRVNKKAIDQIQSLESNNTQIHSLFEQARTNPFSE